MTTPEDLNQLTSQFYDGNPDMEDNRLRLHRIEYEVTLRTILNELPPGRTGLKILDIGGGTGPYSFALAALGHTVTLVDLSPGLLALARSRASTLPPSSRPARILRGDATALSAVLPADERGTFDAVLLLGPLYHIMSAKLRERAVREAWAMVRPPERPGERGGGEAEGVEAVEAVEAVKGGTLFCAWVSRWAHYRDVAMRDPARLMKKRDFYAKHAADGDYVRYDENGQACHAMNHELPANMPGILKRITGEENVKMVGTEGLLAGGLDKLVNELQGEEFQAWVDKCYEVGTDEHGWILADHIVGVVSKTARDDTLLRAA
ncbi:S-adenosyl-L-methionine-dependent methyltransferase [Cubamyces sp. BRFM 1775]|nr:S-adenosyl-L-methionine-dependent methyltransferase [Cubamyces sp. BRFM 1775]